MTAPSFVIGIAGGTAAGKTAVAEELADAVDGLTIVALDDYYEERPGLSPDERAERNYDHPDAFEWDLLVDHLDRLLAGEPVRMPRYDFSDHARAGYRRVAPGEVVVVEGILALYDPRLRERYDLAVYVDTDADVRVLRRIRRDVVERDRDLADVVDQYLATVKPMHERFVAPTRRYADVVVPRGVNRAAVGLIAEKARAESDAGSLDVDLSPRHEGTADVPPGPRDGGTADADAADGPGSGDSGPGEPSRPE